MADTTLNTKPIFSSSPVFAWTTLTAANTAKDGTGTTSTVFTADASNGGRCEKIRIKSLGTNAATVLRIFINNGSASSTATNNILYEELTLTATTVTETAAQSNIDVLLNLALPPGYKINVCLGTAVSAGYAVSAPGGKY
jgi:hypothetical protein